MNTTIHHHYMSLALDLAKQGRLTVSPNPMVGCVIVNHHSIVGKGFHQQAGHAHAEIYALQEAGDASIGATAYITLEPCNHHGRTPPCTEALIQAGIKQVYIPSLDPNPLVSGRGVEKLTSAGIDVRLGLCANEAKILNEIFFHYMHYQRPFVIAKWAMSLDGKTVTHEHDCKKISSKQSHLLLHETRQQVDAILVGAKTAIHDDPLLTVRSSSMEDLPMKQPIKIILSGSGHLPLNLKMFDHPTSLIATTSPLDASWNRLIKDKKIEVMLFPKNKIGKIDLNSLLIALGKKGITSLLVEGGMTTHENFFEEGLVNKIQVYLAPVIIGKLKNKKKVTQVQVSQLDDDYYFVGNYSIEE
jgi:diaminohydroxyphosphoribosylaminopyrimidine deaminase/5-amino-6-(5-phosphoribosylamino)uracil reductase